MANISRTREEEVKNRIRDQFFQEYDATPIIGDIDFAVTLRQDEELSEPFDREQVTTTFDKPKTYSAPD